MKKSIVLEVKNGAYDEYGIHKKICSIVTSSHSTFTICLCSTLRELDLSSYYMSDGRKVTKPIKRILLEHYPKNIVSEVFPKICKEIGELYSPKYNLKAYWGKKELLGSGEYEGRQTCFRDDGENHTSRLFLEAYKRTRCLVLEREGTGDGARCIVYFVGGRNIKLTNFYYNGIKQNYRLFVEALRMLINIPKVSFKEIDDDIGLPIYLNGDGVLVHDDRSFEWPFVRRFPCPHCGRVVNESKMLHSEDASTHYIGCCKDCLGDHEVHGSCDHCEDDIETEDDAHWVEADNQQYCERCYSRYVRSCSHCGYETANHDDWKIINGNYYCETCCRTCDECGTAMPNNDRIELNSGTYCRDCVTTCSDCHEDFLNNDINDNGRCAECEEKLAGEEDSEDESEDAE